MSRPMKGAPVLLRLSTGFVTSRDLKIFLISMRRPRLKDPPVFDLQRAWREVIAKDFSLCLFDKNSIMKHRWARRPLISGNLVAARSSARARSDTSPSQLSGDQETMTPPPSQLLLLLAAYYCCPFHQFSHDRILSAHSNCSLFLSVFTSLKGSDCMRAATAGACKPITDDLQQCRKLRRRRRPAETQLLLVKVSSNAVSLTS